MPPPHRCRRRSEGSGRAIRFLALHRGGDPFDDTTVQHAFTDVLDAMQDQNDVDGTAAAGMTFFGQFVDHDVTLDAQSAIGTCIDPRRIRNVRTPALDLDCVYGDGNDASPHLHHPDHHGFLLFGTGSNPCDLARNAHGTALIGDFRNGENQIISQVQGAFVQMHNTKIFDLPGNGKLQKARQIGRTLAKSIFNLPFIADPVEIGGCRVSVEDSRTLPHRNVFRDRTTLELPSGQPIACLMQVKEIPAPKELTSRGQRLGLHRPGTSRTGTCWPVWRRDATTLLMQQVS